MTDGILVINKPAGLSSAAVVSRLKRLLRPGKIGHTGTLDPFATGVLLIALGHATRISRFFLSGSKGYLATVTLGIETDTYDCTGQRVSQADPGTLSGVTLETIREAAATFAGVQEQIAPAYSALKHNGIPLYKLAREGRAVQKPPRTVTIHQILADKLRTSSEGFPQFDLTVQCSGGTYIRSLAFDLGRKLGCGAHLSGLVRTRSSQFDIRDSISLDDVRSASDIEGRIVSMSQCLAALPVIVADPGTAAKIRQGQTLSMADVRPEEDPAEGASEFIRVVDETDRLLAVLSPVHQARTYNYCCVFHY